MVIDMNEERLDSIEQLAQFLDLTAVLSPRVFGGEAERQSHVRRVLKRFNYPHLGRPDKGVVKRYLVHITGYSNQHLTKLIKRFVTKQPLGQRKSPKAGFHRRYTDEDILLLVHTDKLHDTPSGQVIKHLLKRAYTVFGDPAYERLANISVAQIYNLRATKRYQDNRVQWKHTRPTKAKDIGKRKAPEPEGRAGFIRIDSVHQGDYDATKGVYHINAVDCVTQWEIVASCEKISEAYLLPVLEEIIESFPFKILGIHADNGSEYINKTVAKLLDKLNIELTKSRPRRSNDNALVEAKNGVVVRKFLGYSHIPQRHAEQLNAFHRAHFNPYLNYHRACHFPLEHVDDKGKVRKTYPQDRMQTPFEKLTSLPEDYRNLKPALSIEALNDIAMRMSDNEAAERMQSARAALFESINRRRQRASA